MECGRPSDNFIERLSFSRSLSLLRTPSRPRSDPVILSVWRDIIATVQCGSPHHTFDCALSHLPCLLLLSGGDLESAKERSEVEDHYYMCLALGGCFGVV